jgi:hypothetical protein
LICAGGLRERWISGTPRPATRAPPPRARCDPRGAVAQAPPARTGWGAARGDRVAGVLLQVVCYSVEIFCSNDGMAPSRKRDCLGESDEQATKLTPSAAGGPLTIAASENAMHNLNGFFGCRVAANLWGRGRRVTARGTAGAAAVEGAAKKAAMVGAAMVGAAAGAAGRTCSGSTACRCASAPLRPNHLLLQNYII